MPEPTAVPADGLPRQRRLSGLSLDLRLAVRRLRHDPTFTVAAIFILALGIGATTAIFSVIRGVLLRPLRYPDPARLVRVCEVHPSVAGFCVASPYSVETWAREGRTLDEVGLARDWGFTLARENGVREAVTGGWATPGLFRVLGFTPRLGRLFQDEDLQPGRTHAVVLTEEFWRTEYGADAGILTRSIRLDGEPYVVVGVLPASAVVPGLSEPRFWVPLPIVPGDEQNRRWRGFQVIGRMGSSATPAAVTAELTTLDENLARTFPASHAGWRVSATILRDDMVGSVRGRLWVFATAAGLLLLIACINVAGLMLARGAARSRELAVCAALGSGRGRLVRLVLTESVLLGGIGGALGLWLGMLGTKLFVAVAPPGLPRLSEVGVDGTVLGFALLATAVTVLLCGVAPAIRAGRTPPASLLTGGRTAAPTGGLRRGLVVAEMALACVLLVGAGLVLRSFATLLDWTPGFDRDRLRIAWTSLASEDYRRGEDAAAAYARILANARAVPGIASASLASGLPLFEGRETGEFIAAGSGAESPGITANWFDASEGHFTNVGLRLTAGRDFVPGDAAGAPRVVVVNRTFARRLAPDGEVLGRQVIRKSDGTAFAIVGVVADVAPLNPDEAPEPEIYWPLQQEPRWGAYLIVRSRSEEAPQSAVVQARLSALEPGLSINRFQPYARWYDRRLMSPRFNMLLLSSFGLAAFGLALAGVYGLMRYVVAAGARDNAIRLALGATGQQVVREALLRGMAPVGLGLGLGLAAAAALVRLPAGVLAGVAPTDRVTFVEVGIAVAVVAFLAIWLPVRRIGRGNAMALLRTE